MEKLTDLPNIGPILAERLESSGVATPQALRELGSVAVLCRVRETSSQDVPCRSMLCALEGAVRGIRWHDIPKPQRDALWRRYQEQAAR